MLAFGPVPACQADELAAPSGFFSLFEPVQEYFADWFVRASRAQDEQPHWMTPVVTVTPRLEQELRYDQSFQSMQHSVLTTNYGSGKRDRAHSMGYGRGHPGNPELRLA